MWFIHFSFLSFNSTTVQLIRCLCAASVPLSVFQFHNGTINTTDVFVSIDCHFCFNSTTVQLIQVCLFPDQPEDRCFNSTTVQLIHHLRAVARNVRVFQFHNGTINTGLCFVPTCPSITFQFHNGTINT